MIKLFVSFLAGALITTAHTQALFSVFNKPGRYRDAGGVCSLRVSISPMGGFTRLHLLVGAGRRAITVNDVTGIAFLNNGKVAYSVSPSYGKPGIFLFDCIKKARTRLVAPRNMNRAYPDGTDYFELSKAASNELFFYYVPDVDKAEFTKFESAANLYSVDMAGSPMRHVE